MATTYIELKVRLECTSHVAGPAGAKAFVEALVAETKDFFEFTALDAEPINHADVDVVRIYEEA